MIYSPILRISVLLIFWKRMGQWFGSSNKKQRRHLSYPRSSGARDVGEKPATFVSSSSGGSVLREEPVRNERERDIREKSFLSIYIELQGHKGRVLSYGKG